MTLLDNNHHDEDYVDNCIIAKCRQLGLWRKDPNAPHLESKDELWARRKTIANYDQRTEMRTTISLSVLASKEWWGYDYNLT